MKYIVILGDGMAGYPLPDRGNKTTLQLAKTPFFDERARKSAVGPVSYTHLTLPTT